MIRRDKEKFSNPTLKQYDTVKVIKMERCPFCDLEAIRGDILFHSSNFFVKVGIRLITPGHLLIIPKQHYSCLGDLSPELQGELEHLKEKMQAIITRHFAEPFWIEYGPGRQSVPHAHIHCLPLRGEGYAFKSFIQEIEPQAVLEPGSWDHLLAVRARGLSYIYIEERGKRYLFPFEESTKGYGRFHYRSFFARIKKAPDLAHWDTIGEEALEDDERKRNQTKTLLAGAFQ